MPAFSAHGSQGEGRHGRWGGTGGSASAKGASQHGRNSSSGESEDEVGGCRAKGLRHFVGFLYVTTGQVLDGRDEEEEQVPLQVGRARRRNQGDG